MTNGYSMICTSYNTLLYSYTFFWWYWEVKIYAAQVGCLVYKCCASNYSSSCKKTCTCPMSLGVKYSNWSIDIMFLVAAGSSQALFFLVFLWLGPCSSHWTLDLFCFACRWSWGSLLCILVHFLACHPGHYLLWGMVELVLLLFICWPLPMSYFSWSNVVVIGWSLLWALPAMSPSLVKGDSLCIDVDDVDVALPLIFGGLNP